MSLSKRFEVSEEEYNILGDLIGEVPTSIVVNSKKRFVY
jgi:hypothetical protein